MTPLTPLTHHPLLKGKVNPDLILVSIYLDGSEGSEGSHYVNPFRFAPNSGRWAASKRYLKPDVQAP
jgi:hypothetical protein